MANMLPFFLTGANAKITIDGMTVAFCTDLNYSVSVNRAPAKVLGMYEPSSIEPLGYMVTGSFTLIRYTNGAKSAIEKAGGKAPFGVNEHGNGIGNMFTSSGTVTNDFQVSDSLDPSLMQFSAGFRLKVSQKTSTGGTIEFAEIRDCHITRASTSLNKRNVATQTFEFVAIYADEDSFRADFSGQGQQWT